MFASVIYWPLGCTFKKNFPFQSAEVRNAYIKMIQLKILREICFKPCDIESLCLNIINIFQTSIYAIKKDKIH